MLVLPKLQPLVAIHFTSSSKIVQIIPQKGSWDHHIDSDCISGVDLQTGLQNYFCIFLPLLRIIGLIQAKTLIYSFHPLNSFPILDFVGLCSHFPFKQLYDFAYIFELIEHLLVMTSALGARTSLDEG